MTELDKTPLAPYEKSVLLIETNFLVNAMIMLKLNPIIFEWLQLNDYAHQEATPCRLLSSTVPSVRHLPSTGAHPLRTSPPGLLNYLKTKLNNRSLIFNNTWRDWDKIREENDRKTVLLLFIRSPKMQKPKKSSVKSIPLDWPFNSQRPNRHIFETTVRLKPRRLGFLSSSLKRKTDTGYPLPVQTTTINPG
ncbi:hypothetical protein T05_12588 [Trichinella murrelli]|uniref:Uncharacterized protein n=1 Tax=Trichinella murrelli TaxID=144512 RepID=A0A0V0U858_9BILA|nr:hypothetical protein T05_12588 [Trichinella murrelli]